MEYTPIFVRSKEYVARNIDTANAGEMDQIYKLRHDIFVKKLAWVPGHSEDSEHDAYDANSVFFGVFKGTTLLATARLTPSPHAFMLEKDFAYLLRGTALEHKTTEAVELSRLGVSPALVDRTERIRVSMPLYKALYLWSLQNQIRYWYLVSTDLYLRAMQDKLKIKVERISDVFESEEHDRYYAAFIDLRTIPRSMGLLRYGYFRWFY